MLTDRQRDGTRPRESQANRHTDILSRLLIPRTTHHHSEFPGFIFQLATRSLSVDHASALYPPVPTPAVEKAHVILNPPPFIEVNTNTRNDLPLQVTVRRFRSWREGRTRTFTKEQQKEGEARNK